MVSGSTKKSRKQIQTPTSDTLSVAIWCSQPDLRRRVGPAAPVLRAQVPSSAGLARRPCRRGAGDANRRLRRLSGCRCPQSPDKLSATALGEDSPKRQRTRVRFPPPPPQIPAPADPPSRNQPNTRTARTVRRAVPQTDSALAATPALRSPIAVAPGSKAVRVGSPPFPPCRRRPWLPSRCNLFATSVGYAARVSQLTLYDFDGPRHAVTPFKMQLLKWVGNKQRFAHEIIGYFPAEFGTYFEPFLGSGAVLATLAPERAVAADAYRPLIEIFMTLGNRPDTLRGWYRDRWERMHVVGKQRAYADVLTSYNLSPNAADLLFLSRACYGGVIRFTKDGCMSTPCGVHTPISPESFSRRVDLWSDRTVGTRFRHLDFRATMALAAPGDLVYCDPPYSDTQSILYGAQSFKLDDLIAAICDCKQRGVNVALSIDGSKASGRTVVDIGFPAGLFEREVAVNCGRSMLKRFQMAGHSLEGELVTDRLLLTY